MKIGDIIVTRAWKEGQAPSIKSIFSYGNTASADTSSPQGSNWSNFCEENETVCFFTLIAVALLVTLSIINIMWCICHRKKAKRKEMRKEGTKFKSTPTKMAESSSTIRANVIETPTGKMESGRDGDDVLDESPTKRVHQDITALRRRRKLQSLTTGSQRASQNIVRKHLSLLPGPAMCEKCEKVAIFRCVECRFDLCPACCAAHGREVKGESVAHVW
jgi:hypothetical protein